MLQFVYCVIGFVIAQNGPVWPNVFQAEFTELNVERTGSATTSGQFFYDYTNKQYRMDRVNGVSDRFCGTTERDRNTPCTHFVKDDKRYLHFPNLNKCCYCCHSDHGCGVVIPTWAQDGTFVENTQDKYGNEVEKWEKMGGQPNYIYATKDTKIITQIEQLPNNFIYFLLNTFKYNVDPLVFQLPQICQGAATCADISFCTRFRNEA